MNKSTEWQAVPVGDKFQIQRFDEQGRRQWFRRNIASRFATFASEQIAKKQADKLNGK